MQPRTEANFDFDLALQYFDEVAALVDSLMSGVALKGGNRVALLLTAKALRARLFFLSVAELARRRYAGPTSALLRCLMELQYVVEAIANNHGFIDDLIAADETQRKRALERLLTLTPEERAANVRDDRINAALATVEPSGRGVHVSEWAKRAGRQQEYNLAYMLLSNDVHASLRGAESHLVLDDTGQPQSLKSQPEAEELPFRITAACDSMLAILWALTGTVLDESSRPRIEALSTDERRSSIYLRALASVESR